MSLSGLESIYGQSRPAVEAAHAAELLAVRYGIVGDLRELGSQQDRNYAVTTSSGVHALKVFHSATGAALVHDQIAAMNAVHRAEIAAPHAVAGLDGEVVQRWTLDGGLEHLAVLLTFVDGDPLADSTYLSARSVVRLADLAGRVCNSLRGLDLSHERVSQWDLRCSLSIVRELSSAVPSERRDGLLALAEQAWDDIEPLAARLPIQVIHGDLTDDNVVVVHDADGWSEPSGVIDFGDLTRSWRIGELAIALTSVLHHEYDGSGVLLDMVRAFDVRVGGLTESELRALWPLVALRSAVLVVSGWQQMRIDPGNDYAQIRMDHEWACFEAARRLPSPVMTNLFLAEHHPAHLPSAPIQLVKVRGQAELPVLSLGPTSAALDGGTWLRGDAEDDAVAAALGSEGVVAIPQGEFRLTRSGRSWGCDDVPNYALIAELAGSQSFELEACASLRVTAIAGDRLDAITPNGHKLNLRGVGAADGVEVGTVLKPGRVFAVAPAGPSLTRVVVRLTEAELVIEPPDFCAAGLAAGYGPLVAGTNAAIGLTEPEPASAELGARSEQARRDRFLPENTERYYADPPEFVRGWGAYLVDSSAQVYLDLVNNVAAIGHSHPALQGAVQTALGRLNTNSRFLYRLLADYSERLLATTWGGGFDSVLLVNSGTEAVDLALRMACLATGHEQVITHSEGYHGWSAATDAITTSAFDNPNAAGTRPSWVSIAASPNPYRGAYRGPEAAAGYLRDASGMVADLVAGDAAPAAVVMESILGNSGGVVPPAGYFQGIIDFVHRAGGLGIADEVQVGFGRTGDSFWAAEAEGARPDILVCAKAMANGFPIGAVITRREISSALGREGAFFSTTGGSPAACAAGIAVLDVMENEGFLGHAKDVGDHLHRQLIDLAARHPIIGAVHGRGLYQGIELVTDRTSLNPAIFDTQQLCEALRRRGIVDQPTSERQNVLKVKPPMTLSHRDADRFVEVLDELLTKGWK